MPYDGARGQMKDTAAGGIRATQGTFSSSFCSTIFELRHEKTCLWGF